MSGLRDALAEIASYRSAVAGLVLIAALVAVAVGAVIAIPYDEAVRLWRGGEAVWIDSPRNALPGWLNAIPGVNLPRTIIATSQEGAERTVAEYADGARDVMLTVGFDFPYGDFPSEVALTLEGTYRERPPLATVSWVMPDGRRIALGEHRVSASTRYAVSQDQRLSQRLEQLPPEIGLFARRGTADNPQVLNGRYELEVEALLFEEASAVRARLVVYGKVHGLAGTDHRRRDLGIAILWGTPIALAFGLLAAVGSSVASLIIAAAGVWFGGWVDGIIQRATEVNAILPALPILILVTTFYSRSLWVILAVVILLNIFSLGIKFYRAFFLQIREAPYIEAARAYGAGSGRMVFLYLIPRVLPVLVPGFVTAIPSFVFLETSLAFLGLGDPSLPTWGKVLNDAYQNGALYKGHYYWVLEPAALLMLTGLSFAMVGFALDRIFNPRLRVQ